jgi:hypothetical protein
VESLARQHGISAAFLVGNVHIELKAESFYTDYVIEKIKMIWRNDSWPHHRLIIWIA